MEWNEEETLNFIEMYRARPLLWDSSNSEHKIRNRRHDALMEIAVSFGVDKQEVERKIKNLQSHFAREKKKEIESRTTGSGADEPYVSKWFAYSTMMFLADKNKPRKTVDNVVDLGNQNEKQEGSQEENNENKENKTTQEQLDETTPTKRPRNKEFKSPKKNMTSKGPLNSTPVFDEAVSLMRSIQSKKMDNKDEYSLYGEQVAIKLRRLASPRSRFMVQNIINNALFEAEMGMYDNAQSRHPSPNTALYGIPPAPLNMQSSLFPMAYQTPTGLQSSANVRLSTPSPSSSYSQSTSPASYYSDVFIDNYSQQQSNNEDSHHIL